MNTKATHSPGPWRQGESDELTIIEDAEGNLVAFVDLDGMTAQDRANFALIAAAPKLLEALKRLVEVAAPLFAMDGFGHVGALDGPNGARAAIAEAEGR